MHRPGLEEIIRTYRSSGIDIFEQFASLLVRYRREIIRSFHIVKTEYGSSEILQRLSNGPMESFNRKPKNLRRVSRGFSNFNYVRNRILWTTRSNPSILAVPKVLTDIRPPKVNEEDNILE